MKLHVPSLIAALGVLCSAAVVSAQQLPADLDATSRARLPYVQRKDTDEASKRLFDIFVRNSNSPTDTLGGPLAFAAYNPYVATALLDLHDGAVGKGTLDAHVRELAILVACRATGYNFEWNGHEPAALRAGVDQKVIDVVRTNGALTGLPDADAAVIRFGRELLNDRKMSSATFAKAKELYGPKGAMDLVAVMSTYAVSGFYAIAVDEHAAPGAKTLPPIAAH
ncbi:MAG TPA: carboxymuconolactone decarboxylase family protein [Gammaproteobacteria bacterium]|jgi:4-carboxymuconolactone decarboxylase|nr:carboxymuconolactone decarboxylase family protein [Gammaproteobacteria bacterium]